MLLKNASHQIRQKEIGNGVGNPLLMSSFNYDYAGQVNARKYKGNDRMVRMNMIDLVQKLSTYVSKKAASRQVYLHINPRSLRRVT